MPDILWEDTSYWGTIDGMPPLDAPKCGFDGSVCLPDNTGKMTSTSACSLYMYTSTDINPYRVKAARRAKILSWPMNVDTSCFCYTDLVSTETNILDWISWKGEINELIKEIVKSVKIVMQEQKRPIGATRIWFWATPNYNK